jgi:DNA polymerase III alpha subunit
LLNLSNRIIDDDGNVIYNNQGILDYIYKFKKVPTNILFLESDDIKRFNEFSEYFGESERITLPKRLRTHSERQKSWFIPNEYLNIDLEVYFNTLCKTDIERERVKIELQEYKRTNMEMLLRFIIFLTDYIKKNGYVLGVGRGSSVCSYCLYLIGVHKINSIEYDLNIKEFLK